MHRAMGILLAYLNCHVNIVFVVAFAVIGPLVPGSNLIVSL